MKIKNIFRKEISKQFLRFCLIGIEKTLLTYLVFIILYYFFSVYYLIAGGMGAIAGISLGFVFDKVYTFKSKINSMITLPRYFLIYLLTFLFYIFSIKYLVESFEINPILSNIIIQPPLVLFNFFGTKMIVFKNRKW
jgi:putative flippase GtrA